MVAKRLVDLKSAEGVLEPGGWKVAKSYSFDGLKDGKCWDS